MNLKEEVFAKVMEPSSLLFISQLSGVAHFRCSE